MGNGVGQSINGVLFTHPDLKPYEVVYNALARIKSRISEMGPYRADVRPYIQGWQNICQKDTISNTVMNSSGSRSRRFTMLATGMDLLEQLQQLC